MKSRHLQLIVLMVVVIIVGVVVGKIWTDRATRSIVPPTAEVTGSDAPLEITPALQGKLKADYELVATESGQTALELLQSGAEVETKSYGSAGDFVTKINGLEGNNEYYWAFYLNDEYAEKGASQTTLKEGDRIKFVYEAVTLTN